MTPVDSCRWLLDFLFSFQLGMHGLVLLMASPTVSWVTCGDVSEGPIPWCPNNFLRNRMETDQSMVGIVLWSSSRSKFVEARIRERGEGCVIQSPLIKIALMHLPKHLDPCPIESSGSHYSSIPICISLPGLFFHLTRSWNQEHKFFKVINTLKREITMELAWENKLLSLFGI